MSDKGNCFGNGMVEAFFKMLQAELVWRVAIQSRAEGAAAIGRYIDSIYNPIRRHSALSFKVRFGVRVGPRRTEIALQNHGASPARGRAPRSTGR